MEATMNIESLFALLIKQAGIDAFREELRRQLQEDKKVKEQVQAEEKKQAKRQRVDRNKRNAKTQDASATEDGNKEDELLVNFLNQKNNDGNTLLHIAVAIGSFAMVEELIGLGVALDTKNNNQETALMLAEAKQGGDYSRIAALLKTRG